MLSDKVPAEIKSLLAQGKLNEANQLLGYPYSLTGKVVEGFHIGKKLGFPTANIDPAKNSPLLLAYGVYAVKIKLDNSIYKGMANVGIRPTMTDHHLTIEVNIFDFSQEIYGNVLTVYFIDRIRDEKKFSGLEEMKRNIDLDKVRALELLSGPLKPDPNTK